MLTNKELLQNSKNLLAFSAGVDSSALFFLLLENNIEFDIAIVDYGLRAQSKEEVAHAQALAKTHHLNCHLFQAPLISKNFEASARDLRYDFFEKLITQYTYHNLLTAHHLGDRFEWMLMQFCKGAGCVEMAGMQAVEERKNYTLVRPLLGVDKLELLEFLKKNKLKYFEDESNTDEKYKRNTFRKHHTTQLLQEYRSGIKQSFMYIDEDVTQLITQVEVQTLQEFTYFKSINQRSDIFAIDKYFKSLKKVLTAKEKELLKDNASVIIARKYVVTQECDLVMIAPYIKVTMSKEFKEKMRVLRVDPKLRGYISQEKKVEELLTSLLS